MNVDSLISAASGLVGSIIGAAATYFVTRSSLNRQHENNKIILQIQEDNANLIALKSVRNEIESNIVMIGQVEKVMEKLQIDFINLKASGIESGIKDSKWEKHSDRLDCVLSEDQMNQINTFYLNLSVELINQAFSSDRVEKLISSGLTAEKLLDGEITKRGRGTKR
ncbi:hypothetical protein [Fontibacillus sp. BL9]|uniref:hypothetical protein n=1 Tax=Fontibacillus sp. BL9 TaxID=3389971 RepID=UPI00397D3756